MSALVCFWMGFEGRALTGYKKISQKVTSSQFHKSSLTFISWGGERMGKKKDVRIIRITVIELIKLQEITLSFWTPGKPHATC